MPEKPSRLHRTQAALIVVDLQEKLLPAMFEKERVLGNAVRLIRAMTALNVPVLATEQYRKGLGPPVPEVAQALAQAPAFEKTAFSACGADGFNEALAAAKVSQAILCGVEAHVCVCQTCLDLSERGFEVFVVADAISARTPENLRCGLERMRDAGGVIVSTEMALFELIEKAGTEEFKKILALVK